MFIVNRPRITSLLFEMKLELLLESDHCHRVNDIVKWYSGSCKQTFIFLSNVEKSLNPTGLIWAFTLPSVVVITNLAVTLCKNVQLTSQWSTYRFSRKWRMSFHYTIRHSISQLERVRHTTQTKSHRPVHSRTVQLQL